MGRLIKKSFYDRPVLTIAPELLGCWLCRRLPDGQVLRGRIVEVEAYLGRIDPASHSFRGPTNRNRVMFGPPGHSYVYFTYGMHHCVNVVTEAPGTPTAILIRGLDNIENGNGPGRICKLMELTREQSGIDLTTKDGGLWIEHGTLNEHEIVMISPRIGISVAVDKPWRYFVKGSPGVTKNPLNKSAIPFTENDETDVHRRPQAM
jgi:DNA-3-methyladenine glycosylase